MWYEYLQLEVDKLSPLAYRGLEHIFHLPDQPDIALSMNGSPGKLTSRLTILVG